MRKLTWFVSVSADGYFSGKNGDISWSHKNDPEWNEFVGGNASGGGELLFGRVTYEMMARHWPTDQGRADNAEVAEGMSHMPKVVVSRSLDKVAWSNTRIVKGELIDEVRRMKAAPGENITLLGSGSIATQL